MSVKTNTREVAPLSMRAAVVPDSVNVERRTVDLTWTTGARVLRSSWIDGRFWEELSLDPKHVRMQRLNNGAPLLDSHDMFSSQSVVGVVESGTACLEKGKGKATVRFARAEDDPNADQIFRKIKDGILQNVSVGYRVYRMEKTEDGADKIPVMRAVDWEPYELSVVPVGADDGAGFRSNTHHALNTCEFIHSEYKENRTMADPVTTPTTPPAPAVATPAPTTPPPTDFVERAAQEARATRAKQAEKDAAEQVRLAEQTRENERARQLEIRRLARLSNLGDEFAERMISTGAEVDAVRKIVLDQLAENDNANPTSQQTRFEAGDDARDKFIRGATAAVIERAGHKLLIVRAMQTEHGKQYLANTVTDGGEFRGMRMADLARISLERRGVNTRGLYGETLIKRALEFRDAGMNTSSDFTVLLESVVNKVFLGQYAMTPTSWRSWCGVKSVQDFRTTTFYRPGTFGRLDSVTESGEIKHKNIPDGAKATIAAATKGNIVGISRKAMVNDDLGAFRDVASGLGLAAAQTIEYDAYAMLTANSGTGANAPDGTALFTAGHGNIGSTGAMSVATLDSMRAKMALQKDASSNMYLALSPAVLVVPVELKGTAKTFNMSSADPTDSKNANVYNRVNGLFREIVDSPYLSVSSATRHYAFADPAIAPCCVVGFIDGQEAPQIASKENFETDGLQVRVILDYGTAVIDTRGGVTCAGA